jgi:hypothetical protein
MQGDEARICKRGALGATSNEHKREVITPDKIAAER